MAEEERDVTKLLAAFRGGAPGVLSESCELIYSELRVLAAAAMRRERADHTLQPTALVNEAFLKLFKRKPPSLSSRKEFFVAAARVMRQILVDHARKRGADKREGDRAQIPLADDIVVLEQQPIDLLDLNDALNELSSINAEWYTVVELRCFSGLTIREVAIALNVSDATVDAHWKCAKEWLKNRMDR